MACYQHHIIWANNVEWVNQNLKNKGNLDNSPK